MTSPYAFACVLLCFCMIRDFFGVEIDRGGSKDIDVNV